VRQALGLISKVQLTEGRSRKPAFQYIGPPVEDLEITEEQKQEMPAIRYPPSAACKDLFLDGPFQYDGLHYISRCMRKPMCGFEGGAAHKIEVDI
jgi:hypothetical protein